MKQRRYRVIILTDFPSPFLVTKKKIIGNQPELLVYDVLKETFWSSASCLLFGRKKAFANFAPPLCFFCKFAELFAQGTEDTELTLTREGDYVGSTDDFVEVIT